MPPALLKGADRERHGEPERRDEAGELSSVMEGLRHHRVREHRQDRAAREREHDGDGPRRGAVERDVAASEARPKPRGDEDPETHDPAPIAARPLERRGRGDRLRKVRDEHSDEERDADCSGLEHGEAEDERLRNPVEDDPEDERPPGVRWAGAAGAAAAARRSMRTSAPKKTADPARSPSAIPPSPAEVSKASWTSS